MRILARCSLIIAATLALATPAAAKEKEPGWCAEYRNGGNNCGFFTHEQCMASVSGVGGFCNRNPFAEPDKSAKSKDKSKEQSTESKTSRKEKQEAKERAAPAQKPVAPPAAAQPAPAVVQPTPPPAAAQPPAAPAQSTQQLVSSFENARALILSGKYDAGIAAMKSLGYDDHPDVASAIGFAYAKLGNLNEARAWYNKALAADPNHVRTWSDSGALYVVQGDIEKARRDLDRVKAICGGTTCREYQELNTLIAAKAK